MNLDEALRDARDELAAAEQRLQEATGEVERLRAEIYGLELALARHNGQPGAVERIVGRAAAETMSRTTAVLRVLAEADRPLSPTEIAERLPEFRQPGVVDTHRDVSAALSYLRRNHSVGSVGRGQWVLVRRDASNDEPSGEARTATKPMEVAKSKED